MREYARAENPNTAADWDRRWAENPRAGRSKRSIHAWAGRRAATRPETVVEVGFGTLTVARMVGPARWVGFDFSGIAVERARMAGFQASEVRAGDLWIPLGVGVVALEVLVLLSEDELERFMDKASRASWAIFSVPPEDCPDEGFRPHQRSFGGEGGLRSFLSRWWGAVETARIATRLVAYCEDGR